MKALCITLATLASIIFFAAAQTTIVEKPLVVNPTPAFAVNVFTTKAPCETFTPSYRAGETASIGVTVSEASYVYLFVISEDGVLQILPNRYDAGNYVRPGGVAYFPGNNATYELTIAGEDSVDRVFALASRTPIASELLSDVREASGFLFSPSSSKDFAKALEITLRGINMSDWATDMTAYIID